MHADDGGRLAGTEMSAEPACWAFKIFISLTPENSFHLLPPSDRQHRQFISTTTREMAQKNVSI